MKSKNTISSTSQRALKSDQKLIDQLKEEIQKIKKPFLNRVQFSKLRIENKVRESNKEKQKLFRSEEVIQNLIQKQTEEEFETPTLQHQITSETDQNKNQTKLQSQYTSDFENKKQNSVQIQKSHITQWLGRDKQRIFKNSSVMIDELQTVLNKKLPSNQIKKKQTYSYRRDEKQMLQRIFSELKNPTENSVIFKKIYQFFDQCQLFYQVYDIIPKELQDLVSSSAHTYPDRLTKKQFFDLFLINPQARKFDQLQNKVLKNCCLEQQYWKELEQLFSQLDTFGCGTVRTSQFFHKMKTVSASKQLLEAKTIFYPNVKKYYSLKRVLFELQNRKTQPQKLEWVQLKSQIINFSHTQYPSMDEIFLRQIKAGYIEKDSNTFLLKSDTLAILKKQFQRCPKFCQSFVKCRYFCEQLLLMQSIELKKDQPIRQNSNGKGYVSLLSNIRMLQLKGPEFFDMDEMLTYFSVKGFQQEENLRHFKESFDTKSTASDEQFQERKKQQIRLKRMKSLDNIKKIMMKSPQQNSGKQRKKCSFKPVKIQEFNLTKPRDHLTIRQMKVKEMIEQKILKQQAEIKPYVTANPLPASINPQRYHKEQNKQKMKLQLERQRFNKKYQKYQKQLSYLQATTKLFKKPNSLNEQDKQFLKSEKKKQFQHTPISWFVKERNLLNVIQSEKQERRKNRLRQTRQKYQYGYWRNMPYQYDQNQEEDLTHKSQDSIDIHVKQIQQEKTQNHQQKLKTTIVPDFAKLQKQFMQQLESKKKMKSPTVVKEFNFSVSKKKPLQYQQEIQTKRPQTPKKEKDLNKRESVPVIIGTTKKYESMVELTQMKIAQKNYEAEMKKLQQKQRKKKQKAFAKFMNKVLRQQNLKSKRQSADKTTRRNNSSSRIQHESQLRKIYQKVLSRPFLFQIAGQESKGMKKQGKYSKKHKKSVPQKVKIPSDDLKLQIPPLKYIDSEEFPVQYENGKAFQSDQQEEQRYFVNEFQWDSHLQQQESFAQKIIQNQRDSSYKVNSFAEHLNQSF